MRWLTFIICAAIVITLQVTLAPRVAVLGVQPDWVLALVVFFALHGRNADVLIGAWIVGAACGLHSLVNLGVLSLLYSLIALVVYSMREYLFRERRLTHFLVTCLAAALFETVVLLLRAKVYGLGEETWGGLQWRALLKAVYTGLWAVVLHAALLRFDRTLGVIPVRRRRSLSK